MRLANLSQFYEEQCTSEDKKVDSSQKPAIFSRKDQAQKLFHCIDGPTKILHQYYVESSFLYSQNLSCEIVLLLYDLHPLSFVQGQVVGICFNRPKLIITNRIIVPLTQLIAMKARQRQLSLRQLGRCSLKGRKSSRLLERKSHCTASWNTLDCMHYCYTNIIYFFCLPMTFCF